MIRFGLVTLPVAALLLSSCEKAKNMAEKAADTVKDKIHENLGAGEDSKVDPELQKLVDQNEEGILFRKDLPFPTRLDVRVTSRNEIAGRISVTSAIEKRNETLKGTRVEIFKLEKSGDQVRHTPEQSSFVEPVTKGADEPRKIANPLEQAAPAAKPVTFHRAGKVWKVENSGDFRSAVLSRQLGPVLDQLLIDNALSPRPLWFGGKRIKPGEKVSVSAASLSMIVAGNGKGSVNLTLEGIEAVGGHPCGRFAITGEYSRKQFPDFEGNLDDQEVNIQSGRIWLSLIHPIVLKEELDTIQSFRSGGQGGLVGKCQGTVKVSKRIEWKAL